MLLFKNYTKYNNSMNINEARIVFMGTPEIAATVLEGLVSNGFNIVALVAQPDRPVGRKQILTPVPSKVIANKYNIPCFQPVKIRNDFEFLKELKPDLLLTIAYGQIVPQAVLDIPTLGALNLHGSILPKYRGAAPIQNALLNGDEVSGMTLMRMVKVMDAGEIFATKTLNIEANDNNTSLFKKMANCALELALESLPKFLNGELIGMPQDENLVSFAPSIKPEEEKIDLNVETISVVNKIRALADEPGAYLFLNNDKVKIFKAIKISDKKDFEIGTITKADKNGLYIQGLDGEISVLELQKQGKNRMFYKDFLNGNQGLLGQILK